MSRALLVLILLAGCAGHDEVNLDLTGSCPQIELFPLDSLLVVAYGQDQGHFCVLESRCLTLGMESSIEEIEQTLRAKPQPLLSADSDALTSVGLLGFATQGCTGGNPRMCGIADVAPGTLTVQMRCEGLLPQCDLAQVPACP